MSLHINGTTDVDEALEILANERLLKERTAFDEDLPGCGEFYCVLCDKYFISQSDLDHHKLSKVHRRKVIDSSYGGWDSSDAEFARCPSKPDNGCDVSEKFRPDPYTVVPELRARRDRQNVRLQRKRDEQNELSQSRGDSPISKGKSRNQQKRKALKHGKR